MRMILKVNWKDFESEIEKYKSERTDEALINIKEDKQSWETDVITYDKTSFEPENRNFAYEFKAQRGYTTEFKLDAGQEIRNTIQALKDEINGLDYYLKILLVADAIGSTKKKFKPLQYVL